MATQITNYQCPACTAPLHFVGESGRLECDYCGSSFDIAEIEAFYAEKEAKAAEAAGADAISLINTLLGTKIDIRRRSFVLANKTATFRSG